jgi:hypothetical protein
LSRFGKSKMQNEWDLARKVKKRGVHPQRAFRNTEHEHSIESNWRRKDNVENEKA